MSTTPSDKHGTGTDQGRGRKKRRRRRPPGHARGTVPPKPSEVPVDPSPDEVAKRREAQSGPGAPGVPLIEELGVVKRPKDAEAAAPPVPLEFADTEKMITTRVVRDEDILAVADVDGPYEAYELEPDDPLAPLEPEFDPDALDGFGEDEEAWWRDVVRPTS